MPSNLYFKERNSDCHLWSGDVAENLKDYERKHPALRVKCQVRASQLRIWGHQFPLLAHQRQPQHDHCLETERQRRKMSSSRRMEIQWRCQLGVLFPLHSFVAGTTHPSVCWQDPRQCTFSTHSLSDGKDACLFKMAGSLTSMTLTTS